MLWCLGMQARRRCRQCRGLSWSRDVQVGERHGGEGGWQRGGGRWLAHGDRGAAHCWLTVFFICSTLDFIVSRMDAMVSVTSAAEGKHGSECVLRARARGCGGARRLMRAAHFRVESRGTWRTLLVASPHLCKCSGRLGLPRRGQHDAPALLPYLDELSLWCVSNSSCAMFAARG